MSIYSMDTEDNSSMYIDCLPADNYLGKVGR